MLDNQLPAERQIFPQQLSWLQRFSRKKLSTKVLRRPKMWRWCTALGTGKTTTLVETIYETFASGESGVGLCAKATRRLTGLPKLVDRGGLVLRIRNQQGERQRCCLFTYRRRFESHPLYGELWSIRKAIRETNRKGTNA